MSEPASGSDAQERAPIVLERTQAGLAVVTVDAPPLNLFTRAMQDDLLGALEDLERTPARAVLFRFEGKIVTGGVDIAMFDSFAGSTAAAEFFAGHIELTHRIEALPCPTVFAAHALCLTWAFEIALACDLILAAEGAKFGLIEASVGLTPALGGTQRLAERAGSGRAREFVMTGERYDAAVLQEWGVVNRVLPAEGFAAAAREFAARLASGPTRAHAATKDVIRAFHAGGVVAADAVAGPACAALFDTEDLKGALQSFLTVGRGKAVFHGR